MSKNFSSAEGNSILPPNINITIVKGRWYVPQIKVAGLIFTEQHGRLKEVQ
jgi:hypothetical protein